MHLYNHKTLEKLWRIKSNKLILYVIPNSFLIFTCDEHETKKKYAKVTKAS